VEKQSVYIETSVVSYLTARPSRNLVVAAWQSATVTWWEERRQLFDLYLSGVVLREVAKGDPVAAARRQEALTGLNTLVLDEETKRLVQNLMNAGALPREAMDDAFHLAVAAVNKINYLLTWNCRHIDNAEMKPLMRTVCAEAGHRCPEICTPQELMGVDYDAGRSD